MRNRYQWLQGRMSCGKYYNKTGDVVKHILDDPKLCRMTDDVIDALRHCASKVSDKERQEGQLFYI